MKHLITILILSFLFSNNIFAEQPRHQNIELTNLEKNYGNKNRPRCPARHNEIECFYQDDYLHITFEYPEGNATLSITDFIDTTYLIQQFSTSIPSTIYIGEIDQSLKITLTTESSIYEGILTL